MEKNINTSFGKSDHISDDILTYIKLNTSHTFEVSNKDESRLQSSQSKQTTPHTMGREKGVQKSLYQSHKKLSDLQHLIGS
jgi:hypothetical protein